MGWFQWLQGRSATSGVEAWRRAWEAAVAGEPERETVDSLRADLQALGEPEEEIEIEREMLDGLIALCDLVEHVRSAGLPTIETGHRVVGADACHFSAPASMPDDPGHPAGRLLMTPRRAVFAGGPGAVVPWHAVPDALHGGRDIVLVHRGRERMHRFRCNSFSDALTGAYIARRLAGRRN